MVPSLDNMHSIKRALDAADVEITSAAYSGQQEANVTSATYSGSKRLMLPRQHTVGSKRLMTTPPILPRL